jgi:purine catabolism regulator
LDFVVYAGERGLSSRLVRTVCVLDTLDIDGWIFGGEFLLTSGYIFKDCSERLGDIIEMSDRGGAAALGVKTGRFIDRIPQDAIRAADRLGFPLLGIPFHYAHTDIIKTIIDIIAKDQYESMRVSDRENQAFLDNLLNMDSAEGILSLLHARLERDVMLFRASNGERNIVAQSKDFRRIAENEPIPYLLERYRHYEIHCSAPLLFHENIPKPDGYLVMDMENGDETYEKLLQYAQKSLRLHLKWERESQNAEKGAMAQFVQDILYKRLKHTSEISSRARSLGWEMGGSYAVAFVALADDKKTDMTFTERISTVYDFFRSTAKDTLLRNAPYALVEDGAAFIIKTPPEQWHRVKKILTETFEPAAAAVGEKTGLRLIIGVGSAGENLMSCDKSFREAKRIVMMSREKKNSIIPYFWEDMGVYKLLVSIFDTEEAKDFSEENLGKLLARGSRTGSDDYLLETLFCIIRHNWQLKPVSKALNLHYNTVKYRYRKIGNILGVDIESSETRINLSIAMELYTLYQTKIT